MKKRDGKQQGPQTHGEGQHGDKTHEALIEGLQHKATSDDAPDKAPPGQADFEADGRPIIGNHRLREDRQQHDEAEKNSEANRLRR
jgi:hypothetical protein